MQSKPHNPLEAEHLPTDDLIKNDSYHDSEHYKIEFYLNVNIYKELLGKFIKTSKEYIDSDPDDFSHIYFDKGDENEENMPSEYDTFDERVKKGRILLNDITIKPQVAKKQEIEEIETYINELANDINITIKLNGANLESTSQFNEDFTESTFDFFNYFFSCKLAFSHFVPEITSQKISLSTKYLKSHIYHGLNSLTKTLKDNLSHLSSVRGNLERIYLSEGNAFNELITEFAEIIVGKIGYPFELNFINEWVEKFEIGEMKYLEIIPSPEYNINAVYLKKSLQDKERKPLIDLGFGISQLIAILIKIAVEASKSKKTSNVILIEEPEANLHPKYQSLLADMFIDAAFRFKTQFILETHSEYLIRRFQFWIAQGHVDSKNISLYHIDLTKSKNPLKKLALDEIRNMKQELGNSFFDELTTMKDELEKIQEINTFNNNTNPLIITEGKTDAQHIKKAKEKLNLTNLDVDFYNITEDWGDSKLKNLLESLSKVAHSRIIIGIFDRDDEAIIKDIEHNGQYFKDYKNNIFGICIPLQNETIYGKAISIEHYYPENLLLKQDDQNRRLFLGSEFFDSGNSRDGKYQTKTGKIQHKVKVNGVIDEKVFERSDLEQKNSIALTKANFANLIETSEDFIGDFDFKSFSSLFDRIETILKL